MVFSLFRTKETELAKRHSASSSAQPSCTIASHTRKERVALAFDQMPLDEREMEAICALLDTPGSTAVELSRACGWMDTGWRTQMLLLCQRRRKYLWPEGIASDVTNGIIITALAEYDPYSLTFKPRKDLVRTLNQAVMKVL